MAAAIGSEIRRTPMATLRFLFRGRGPAWRSGATLLAAEPTTRTVADAERMETGWVPIVEHVETVTRCAEEQEVVGLGPSSRLQSGAAFSVAPLTLVRPALVVLGTRATTRRGRSATPRSRRASRGTRSDRTRQGCPRLVAREDCCHTPTMTLLGAELG